MSEKGTDDEFQSHEEPEEPLKAPGPGSPVGGTLGEESEPGQLEDTPTIEGGDQEAGQTQHDAPPDDVGVPDDVPRD
jgi:hypothetical protein